jgi:hypothetical protein
VKQISHLKMHKQLKKICIYANAAVVVTLKMSESTARLMTGLPDGNINVFVLSFTLTGLMFLLF